MCIESIFILNTKIMNFIYKMDSKYYRLIDDQATIKPAF